MDLTRRNYLDCGMIKVLAVIDIILNRRSIRQYEQKDIPNEILNEILEAGRHSFSS